MSKLMVVKYATNVIRGRIDGLVTLGESLCHQLKNQAMMHGLMNHLVVKGYNLKISLRARRQNDRTALIFILPIEKLIDFLTSLVCFLRLRKIPSLNE